MNATRARDQMPTTRERDQILDAGAGLRSDELRRIVARASTPFERLDRQVFASCPDADEQLAQSRLEAWRQAAAKGDAAQFGRFLAWEGLSLEEARRAVTSASLRDDASLPDWAVMLGEVLGDISSSSVGLPGSDTREGASQRFLDREKPLPFEELLTPFVVWAQRELRRRAGAAYHRLTDQAHAAPERALLGQLIDTAAQPLLLAFAAWKAGRQSSFARLLAGTQDAPERDLYRQFIQAMLAGQQVPFFVEYAALARVLATMTTLWVEAQHEFLHRLDADWPLLEQTFGAGAALGRVTEMRPFLSDPHRGRRAVMTLRVEPDVAIVYKPKHLGTEVAYNRLLAWLTERGSPLPLKALRVIDRGSHGWVEYVESLPCDDTAALARHYQRVGMLLCLVYVLDAIDCHYENLIAAGEHPVLIDAETLMQPRVVMEQAGPAHTAQRQAVLQLSNSVMRTALLALWHTDDAMGTAHDYSGLGSHMQEDRRYKGLQWSAINTDQMALTLQEMTIPAPAHHVPTVRGETTCLADWVETVAGGFEAMYRFVLQQRDALLAQGSPLWDLAGQPIRFVFRPTDTYTRLLWQLRDSAYLRDGVERSLGLEVLKRAAAGAQDKPVFWPLLRAERQQMEQLDVPFFTLNSDVDELAAPPDTRVTGLFEASGFDAVLERIKALGEADLELQLQLIQGCLYLRTMPAQAAALAGPPDAQAATAAGPPGTQSPDADSVDQPAGGHGDVALDDAALLAEAETIARRLRERAIQAPDGTVTWLAPHLDVRQERFQFQPMSGGLYDGRLGVALFLAALARVSGEDEWRALCLSALREDRRALAEPGLERVAPRDVGLAGGLGGTVYGLTRIGTLLDDDTLVADALRAARLLTPEVIGGDTQMDVIGGTTGALLGLLALYDVVHDAGVLASAMACGRHLLAKSVPAETGRAWPTLGDRLLTGFSHGAAGVAYALLRLAEVTDNAEFATAAVEAIAYERSTFLPEAGNWPDFRDFSGLRANADRSAPRPLMSSWCHGASGIGLGRLGGLDILDSTAIRQDIQVALHTTRHHLAHRRGAVDHLCCGAMGQIETLLYGAQRLGQPELAAEARAYASGVVRAAQQRGYALEIALPASVYVPGLFRGEAGIGYTLLRLIDPDRLPLILLCA